MVIRINIVCPEEEISRRSLEAHKDKPTSLYYIFTFLQCLGAFKMLTAFKESDDISYLMIFKRTCRVEMFDEWSHGVFSSLCHHETSTSPPHISCLLSSLAPLAPPVPTWPSHGSVVCAVTCLGVSVRVRRCVQEIRSSEMWPHGVRLRAETADKTLTRRREGGGERCLLENPDYFSVSTSRYVPTHTSVCLCLFCLSSTAGQQLVVQDGGADSSWTEY